MNARIVQRCEVRHDHQKCGRVAGWWVQVEYPNYRASSSVVLAACDACRQDERVTAQLGPILVTTKATV